MRHKTVVTFPEQSTRVGLVEWVLYIEKFAFWKYRVSFLTIINCFIFNAVGSRLSEDLFISICSLNSK